MSIMFTSVIYSVRLEMKRQQKLKEEGRFKHTCRDPEMSDPERLAVLMEEVGETARAILEKGDLANDKHHAHLREELIQVAAVALSWVEGLDDRARDARDREDSGQIVFPFSTAELADDLPHYTDTETQAIIAAKTRTGPLAGERLHDWSTECQECGGTGRDGNSSAPCPICLLRSSDAVCPDEAATFLLSRPDGNYPPSTKVYSGQDMIGEEATPRSRPAPCFTCGAIEPDPCVDIHSCPMMERHPVRDETCNSDARLRGAPTDALDVFCTREAGHDGTCSSGSRVWY